MKKRGFLLLKEADENKEIEFELAYLASLTVAQRFSLVKKKNREIKKLLAQLVSAAGRASKRSWTERARKSAPSRFKRAKNFLEG